MLSVKKIHSPFKVADFDHPTCIRRPRRGWPRSKYAEIFGIRKLDSPGRSCGVVCVILRLAVLVELRLGTDRQTRTNTDTDTGLRLVPRMHSIARKKTVRKSIRRMHWLGKKWGGDISLPSGLRGLGGASWLLQRGPGQRPGPKTKTIFVHFYPKNCLWLTEFFLNVAKCCVIELIHWR